MLATAAEVAQRSGNMVAWASESAVAAAFQGSAITFLPLQASGWHAQPPLPESLRKSKVSAVEVRRLRQERALDSWLHPATLATAVESLKEVISEWGPDVIIAEPYAAAAALAAEALGLPLIVCGRPALPELDPDQDQANQSGDGPREDRGLRTMLADRIRYLCRQHNVAGAYWDRVRGLIRSPLLHLDYFSRRWYRDLPAIGAQTCFVGGGIADARHQPTGSGPQPHAQRGAAGDRAAGEGNPRVLVTLGSLFNEDPAFFRLASEAILLEGGQPLVVTGRPRSNTERPADPTLLQQRMTNVEAPNRMDEAGAATGTIREGLPESGLPAGVEVRDWVDFEQVLPTVKAIVHHGGVGTTHAALRHGLPQVAVPHAGDQQPQAGRITQAGVGYGVRPADYSLANARWLARQLLHNESLQVQARAWQAELQRLGGIHAAADALQAACAA